MKRMLAAVLLATVVCLGSLARPAQAQFSISIDIGTPPPAQRVEVVHEVRPGWIWTPGYWAWEGHRHVWMDGRWVHTRPGMRWEAARWDRHGDRYRFSPGHWEQERHAEARPGDWDRGNHYGWNRGRDRR
jgi:hypothetical protein